MNKITREQAVQQFNIAYNQRKYVSVMITDLLYELDENQKWKKISEWEVGCFYKFVDRAAYYTDDFGYVAVSIFLLISHIKKEDRSVYEMAHEELQNHEDFPYIYPHLCFMNIETKEVVRIVEWSYPLNTSYIIKIA